MLARLTERRDAVLDRAGPLEGKTLLDVGCGEGLVGFGALDRGVGTVVFSDVSEPLLAVCRDAADEIGLADRCRYVRASADDLTPITSESVDVVTTRSVLIYVSDKRRAFEEFCRVLRSGGRISLYEPINRFAAPEERGRFCGYDLHSIAPIVARLEALFDELQPPGSDPMLDFDERDLVELCSAAGFLPVDLELHVEIHPHEPKTWDAFVNAAGNPRIPTLAEAMDHVLDADEREQLTAVLRPLVENGLGVWRMAHASLWATKPLRR